MILLNYIASFFLIVLGLYCIVVKYNLVKTVIGLSIMDYGVNPLVMKLEEQYNTIDTREIRRLRG